MSDKIDEQLSALMDDELPEHEQQMLFKRMESDPELRARWERFHTIRDTLHRELPAAVDTDLAERIRSAVENEPPLSAGPPVSATLGKVARPVAGLAVAASVAALAIVGLQHFAVSPDNSPIPQVAVRDSAPQAGRVSGTRWDTQAQGVESRLNGYLVNHSEYTSSTNLQGMMHYVRIAGYDGQ